MAVWQCSEHLFAQVVRLPAVLPPEQSPPGQLVSHPDSTAEILQAPGQDAMAPPALYSPGASDSAAQEKLPPGVRNGVFQKVLFDATWLSPGGADGMGSTDLQLQGIFAVPCPRRDTPLVVTPGFATHWLQAPAEADLPPRLNEGYVQFRWLAQVSPQLGLDLALTPGAYSDFQQSSSDAFRLTAHAAAAWTWTEKIKIAFGAAYLDMPDNDVIPVGGLIWTPQDDVQFDVVFPHPRAARRLRFGWQRGDDVQHWAYLSGEFANDAWAIARSDGSTDQVMLRDYRLILGVERRAPGGLNARFEVGYVFGRRVRYVSDAPDFYPADTVMLRGGLSY